MKIQLDMYQTLAAAVLVLLLGNYLRKKINFLENSVSGTCYRRIAICLSFYLVYAIPRELLNFPLMIRSEKSAWYFSLHQ